MRRLLLSTFLLLAGIGVSRAQDAPPAWTRSLAGKVSATQAGFNNWTAGGINTLALTSGIDGKAEKTTGAWTQSYDFRAGFGFIKQDTLDVRKAEDLILFNGSLKYQGQDFFRLFNPTFALSARSQFWEGLNFDKNPFNDGRRPPVKVSDALSPATFTQSLGLTVAPAPWFTQRFGFSAKQTVVTIERLRALYSLRPDQSVKAELGLESVSQVDREVFENVRYKSSLGLFTAFNNAAKPDLLWENFVTMRVNSWLTMNFEWALLLDEDRSKSLQVKEVFSVGFVYQFI